MTPPADLLPCLHTTLYYSVEHDNHYCSECHAGMGYGRPQPIAGDGWNEAIEAVVEAWESAHRWNRVGDKGASDDLAKRLIAAFRQPAQPAGAELPTMERNPQGAIRFKELLDQGFSESEAAERRGLVAQPAQGDVVERMRDALTQAEACMSIVEPRSDKAEYLRILGVIRAALSAMAAPK
jgi:hypothetical protein